MVERLPLTSVRTFAVVARLLSISRAAEELNVTPSAVSHQIKVLEEYLSATLFQREKNKLKLTPVGQLYMSQVSEGLLLLSAATRTIKSAKGRQVLRIGVPPSLAILWLIGRLGRFIKHNPDVVISLTTVPDPLPLMQGNFDVGFWYGTGVLLGLSADSLGANCAFPICKASLVHGEPGLRSPGDIAHHTLLDSSDESYYSYKEPRQPGWRRWLQSAGITDGGEARTLNFTPRLALHSAVAAGLGVGLSRTLLAVDALASKQVVIPFGPLLPIAPTYHVIYPTHLGTRKDIRAFREWVRDEAKASRQKLQKLTAHVSAK